MEAFGFEGITCDNLTRPQQKLDIFYSHQYVSNETTNFAVGDFDETVFVLEKAPVLSGTLVGTVYRKNCCRTEAIQTFTADMDGNIKFTPIGNPEIKVENGKLDADRGKILLKWNAEPGSCHLVASYEYNIEVDYPSKKKLPNFVKPTFENFFSSQEIAEIAHRAGTICSWDFNCALGDTIMEKYESLYVKCYEMTNVLLKMGAVGYFWIVTSPEVSSIFETVKSGFNPITAEEFESEMIGGIKPMGLLPQVSYRGAINARWRLYTDTMMPSNMLLIGCNDTLEDSSHYGRMAIFNFII